MVRGEQPQLQVILDGVDGNTAGIAMGYILEIAQQYQAKLISQDPALGRALAAARFVAAEPRFWYNPELKSRRYITPGIIALILTIITVFLTSMGIVREKEIGTLEQLMVTPIHSYQLIIGKIVPFSLLAFVDAAVAMLAIYLIFGIGIVGSVSLLFMEAMLFILTTLGLGIAISTIAETQQQAAFIGWFMMIFSILLSGFFVPIANMPRAIQLITYLNPLRYFLVVLREIYLKGSTLDILWPETLGLVAFAVVVFSLAVARFRGKLLHGA
jgi:ABC-2 type transport system permease protein